MRPRRIITATDVDAIRRAITYLQYARDLLKSARATQTLKRVRATLKSAEGAERHAVNGSQQLYTARFSAITQEHARKETR